MKTITIDEDFCNLLPGLDKETFESLEENILQYGCLSPLILWNGILIDGHNRYTICNKHGIPFDTIDLEIKSREEALVWIILNHMSRRNLSPIQLSNCRALHCGDDANESNIMPTDDAYGEIDTAGLTESEAHPVCTAIMNVLAEFCVKLRGYNPYSGQTEIREELREYLDALDKLFSDLSQIMLSSDSPGKPIPMNLWSYTESMGLAQ